MIDSVLNLLFRCPHHRLTRPVAPVTKPGQPHPRSYVVCLDCGKQFEYDLDHMRIGKPIDTTPEKPARKTLGYTMQAGVALAFVTLFKKRAK
jgi:hypothetical protein